MREAGAGGSMKEREGAETGGATGLLTNNQATGAERKVRSKMQDREGDTLWCSGRA